MWTSPTSTAVQGLAQSTSTSKSPMTHPSGWVSFVHIITTMTEDDLELLTPEQEAQRERQAAQAFDTLAQQLALFPELDTLAKQGKQKGKSAVS